MQVLREQRNTKWPLLLGGVVPQPAALSSGGRHHVRNADSRALAVNCWIRICMASPTWWTWVWVNSRSWWWAGRPGVLQFMGSQRVGQDWATELNWERDTVEIGQTELKHTSAQWNPMWLFMVLGCCQAKQNKTEKADFGQPQQKCNSLIGYGVSHKMENQNTCWVSQFGGCRVAREVQETGVNRHPCWDRELQLFCSYASAASLIPFWGYHPQALWPVLM